LLKKELKYTLMGIPVFLQQDYPKSWIRLYAGDKLMAYAECLAVPYLYGNNRDPNFGTPLAEDNIKAQKIWDEDNA
jgi:hypothetical protein